ncbi:uncharacterized protein LOC143658039 [Tamandua tetradactyla]|uniref:uncharacterized protein LOC143658039 n=1 Tax=Tamandua tetradactyla TaxID=48850 RepID=UPI0040546D47
MPRCCSPQDRIDATPSTWTAFPSSYPVHPSSFFFSQLKHHLHKLIFSAIRKRLCLKTHVPEAYKESKEKGERTNRNSQPLKETCPLRRLIFWNCVVQYGSH